ncbi:hypothetical protein MMC12_002756 [Toensbergia leucococca]|nr:hypothetical protein [Toensbergia leucococca]
MPSSSSSSQPTSPPSCCCYSACFHTLPPAPHSSIQKKKTEGQKRSGSEGSSGWQKGDCAEQQQPRPHAPMTMTTITALYDPGFGRRDACDDSRKRERESESEADTEAAFSTIPLSSPPSFAHHPSKKPPPARIHAADSSNKVRFPPPHKHPPLGGHG